MIVRVGERVLADRPLKGTRISLRVELPRRVVALRVTAVDGAGRRSSTLIPQVAGLPAVASPSLRESSATPRLHAGLGRSVRGLARSFPGTSAVYVEDLASGYGAAWNARARFPAASTLKLAIAVTVLRAEREKPVAGSETATLLESMLVRSDNEAANSLLARLGGSWQVEQTLRVLELRDSLMYGGYEVEDRRQPSARAPIPIRVDSQPSFGVGKQTSAWDLARLARAVYLAAAGRGPLAQLGVTPSEARHLLWLLARVGDGGKLGRFLGGSATLLHKAGWLATARHDHGLVVWDGGVFVAAVLTWSASGVGTASDVLAGSVALRARDAFRGVG